MLDTLIPTSRKTSRILMRLGIAFVFLSFGIWEITSPESWTSFVPQFMQALLNVKILVLFHGSIMLVLGLGLLFDVYVRIVSCIATIILLELVVSLYVDSGFSEIFVRDVGLLFLAGSLFFSDSPKNTSNES